MTWPGNPGEQQPGAYIGPTGPAVQQPPPAAPHAPTGPTGQPPEPDVMEHVLVGERGVYRPIGVSTNVLSNQLVVKSGAGVCFGLTGFNNKVAAQFIQVFDLAAIPADGAVPVTVLTAPTVTNFSIDYGPWGRGFNLGIVVCNSTTLATKTIGAADCWFDVLYV